MNVVRRMADRLSISIEKYMPTSFVFAVFLTAIAFILALVFTDAGPFATVQEYYGGFWIFLEFAMQMSLIIVTGYALASAPLVQRGLERIARLPNSTTQAYLSVIVVGTGLAYINWGLGLIGAGFYALNLAKVRTDLDFGYLVAAAYAGVWPGITGSLSISAPLLVNTPDHFMQDQIGLIPLNQTIWSPMHLSVVVLTFLAFLVLFLLMEPSGDNIQPVPDEKINELLPDVHSQETTADGGTANQSWADQLNHSWLFTIFIVALGGSYIVWRLVTDGLINGLTLNSMNFTLLMAGIALHGGLINYVNAINEAITAAAQVVLQFPFYGGIQGIIVGTGLATLLVQSIVDVATASTYPFFVFLITGILNVFVPSAGGQYIVMADILHGAGSNLGVSDATIVSAYTFGDVWTNLLQPFWALPLLGIVGLRIRDVWGYVLMALLTYGLVTAIVTLVIPTL